MTRSSSKTPARLPAFLASTNAAASVEFLIFAPVLIIMLLAGFEVSRMVAAQRHLATFTSSVAWDLAGTNDQDANGKTIAKGFRLYEFATRLGLLMPEVWKPGVSVYAGHSRYNIAMTMVQMTPTVANCSSNCTYIANVAWSWGDMNRSCGQLGSVTDGSAYDKAKLPNGAFQAGAVVVVDVKVEYPSILNLSWLPARTFTYSVYFPVRNTIGGAYLPWDGVANWWSGAKCAGYT
ncbi:MAG: TadE/TadG family type IV pilus assembly protein [Rhodoblastus sp.]